MDYCCVEIGVAEPAFAVAVAAIAAVGLADADSGGAVLAADVAAEPAVASAADATLVGRDNL